MEKKPGILFICARELCVKVCAVEVRNAILRNHLYLKISPRLRKVLHENECANALYNTNNRELHVST